RGSGKIVAGHQSDGATRGWNTRSPGYANIHVIRIPFLVDQLVAVGSGLVIVAQNLVIVLPGEIEPGRGIPIEAGLVLLPKQIEILNPWQTLSFGDVVLVDVPRRLLPVTPGLKEPVVNAGVTHLQRLGEGVD